MNRILALCVASLFFAGAPACADAWVLLARGDGHVVARIDARAPKQIASVEGQVVYGYSRNALVLASAPSRSTATLTHIDKQRGVVAATWPIPAQLVAQMTGPSVGVIVNGDHAYLLTMHFSPDGTTVIPTASGSHFELRRIHLASGSNATYDLPSSIVNPRLAQSQGRIALHSSSGWQAWTFDPARSHFQRVISQSDIDDSSLSSSIPQPGPVVDVPRFSDFVVVPGAGLFHVTRSGDVQPLLRPDLKTTAKGFWRGSASIDGPVLRALAVGTPNEPAVGVLSFGSGALQFSAVSANTGRLVWHAELPAETVTDSVVGLEDGSIAFVDTGSTSIRVTGRTGAAPALIALDALNAAELRRTRIIAFAERADP